MTIEYHCIGLKCVGVVSAVHWAPRPPVEEWLTGRTWRGQTVRIIGDPYSDERSTVYIDGQPAIVHGVDRLRDGGTTTIRTDRGVIFRPAQWRNATSTLDGKTLR